MRRAAKIELSDGMNRKQTVGGTILSYALIVLNALYGIVLMPYIIGQIGAAEYGVYKTISSFASALMVLDLGMGSTAIRFIAKFRVEQKEEKIASCVKMLLAQAAVLAVAAVLVSVGIYASLDVIYRHGLTAAEIARGKQLFLILSVSVVCHLFENVLNGVISGYNRFLFANGIKLVRLILRIGLTVFLLQIFPNSVALVAIDVLLILLLVGLEFWYLRKRLALKVRSGRFDKPLFLESFRYSMTVFVGALVAQISNNLDNAVIGAIKGSLAVAVYSVALQLYNMFLQIGSSVSQTLLPTVVESTQHDDGELSKTKALIVRVGRIQFMLLGAAFVGFVVLGKQFIALLMNSPDYQDAYYLMLILMVPAILELCVNLCLALIRAKNMMGYYTKVLIISLFVNLVVTVVGTYLFDYYAAAVGTAISLLLCRVFMMNAYYKKTFGFRMLSIYRQIIEKTWWCILISAIVCCFAAKLAAGWLAFAFGAISFLAVYIATLYAFGWNSYEKNCVAAFLKKAISKNKGTF